MASGLRPSEAIELRWCEVECSSEGHRCFEGESGQRPQEIKAEIYEMIKQENERGTALGIVAVEHTIVRVRVLKSKNKRLGQPLVIATIFCLSGEPLRLECAGSSLPENERIFSVPAKFGETPPFSHHLVNVAWREIIDSLAGKLKGPVFSSKPYTSYGLNILSRFTLSIRTSISTMLPRCWATRFRCSRNIAGYTSVGSEWPRWWLRWGAGPELLGCPE